MKSTRIEFLGPWYPEFREEIGALVREHLAIAEPQIHKITIRYDNDIEGVAGIMVVRRYHVAHMLVGDDFFELTDDEKAETVIHELTHVLVDPVTRFFTYALDAAFPKDSPLKELLEGQAEDATETVTDGVALAFAELFRELKEARGDVTKEEG